MEMSTMERRLIETEQRNRGSCDLGSRVLQKASNEPLIKNGSSTESQNVYTIISFHLDFKKLPNIFGMLCLFQSRSCNSHVAEWTVRENDEL